MQISRSAFYFWDEGQFFPELCKQMHQAPTVVAQTDVTSVSHERLTSSLSVALSPKPDANDKNMDF